MSPPFFVGVSLLVRRCSPPLCRGLIGESVEEEGSALWQRTTVERARPGKDEAL